MAPLDAVPDPALLCMPYLLGAVSDLPAGQVAAGGTGLLTGPVRHSRYVTEGGVTLGEVAIDGCREFAGQSLRIAL